MLKYVCICNGDHIRATYSDDYESRFDTRGPNRQNAANSCMYMIPCVALSNTSDTRTAFNRFEASNGRTILCPVCGFYRGLLEWKGFRNGDVQCHASGEVRDLQRAFTICLWDAIIS